ncbi:uncharacterized protein LOC133529462 [Cydia pomonella]|uniref:uncharacterized protein LOC133529462 n=1 Tax=Cydia pomonella TaxID=82600 RepID=UPI002ADD8165|nr:uncharacterized protein LOC133529462 [Cydia pomonella]
MKFLYKHTSSLQYIFILILIILQLTKADRRVLEGKEPTIDRNYVVYFIKADDSIQYDAWLCGGAIVSPWYILTSAACVEDVKHMYAIAGYKKYVHYEQLNYDACANHTKRKIIFKCLPRDYQLDYPRVERWANIDLALAQVEKPYDFNDNTYLDHCSYIPNKIEINYDNRLQEPGTNAIVFGWGHVQKWRQMDDTLDYNQDFLLYGSVKLAPKQECMEDFDNDIFRSIIEKYMICSFDEGNLDDAGDIIADGDNDGPENFARDCGPGALRVGSKCVYLRHFTRKRGICQNDHGGPIITWRGPKEVLIGISSVFKVDNGTQNCVPPFLYTSTHCNGEFIHCLMSSAEDGKMNEEDTRRCDALAKEGGFNIIRRTISWIGHPDGPAYNEITANYHKKGDKSANSNVKIRHQIPIQSRS